MVGSQLVALDLTILLETESTPMKGTVVLPVPIAP